MYEITVKNLEAPPVNIKEVLRYAKTKEPSEEISSLLNEVVLLCENQIEYRVCYARLPVRVTDGICSFPDFSFESKDLCYSLKAAGEAVVFAATLGAKIDRLINKYSRIAPSKALLIDAFASERIEALCDEFTKSLPFKTLPRFSAGYGDLKIENQKKIFALLNPQKNIGLTLNESLTMSPSKSVTAFMGIVKYEF